MSTKTYIPFKVKDISLAEWGRKEIRLAEAEMPGLMALRTEFGPSQPPQRCSRGRLSSHDHPNCRIDRNFGCPWR